MENTQSNSPQSEPEDSQEPEPEKPEPEHEEPESEEPESEEPEEPEPEEPKLTNKDIEGLTDDQKYEIEVNKMFGLAKKPIMEYLCYYLHESPEAIFTDFDQNMISDELVLQLDEYEDKGFLHFRLETVPYNYVTQIPAEFRNNTYIIDAIRFIQDAVYEVFQQIIYNNLNESASTKMLDSSIHLELDEANLVFRPVYIFPPRRQLSYMNLCAERLTAFRTEHEKMGSWDTLDEKIKSQWKQQTEQIASLCKLISYDEDKAKKAEDEQMELLRDADCLGIIFTFARK